MKMEEYNLLNLITTLRNGMHRVKRICIHLVHCDLSFVVVVAAVLVKAPNYN